MRLTTALISVLGLPLASMVLDRDLETSLGRSKSAAVRRHMATVKLVDSPPTLDAGPHAAIIDPRGARSTDTVWVDVLDEAILTVGQPSTAADFDSIQAALDAASAGTTIVILDSATYPENLRISKNKVSLRAARNQVPVITGEPGAPEDMALINIGGTDGTTIQGLKLVGGSDDGITAGPGAGATHVMIEGCRFEYLFDTGIVLTNNSTAIIRNNTFIGLGTGEGSAGYGISLLTGSAATIEGNAFADLGAGPSRYGVGVAVLPDASAVVIGNSFRNLRGSGIDAEAASLTAINNTFIGGTNGGTFSDGIALCASSADILNNAFLGVGRLGIATFLQAPGYAARHSTIRIINNLIIKSGTSVPAYGDGIQILSSANTINTFTIVNNTIADNARVAINFALGETGSRVTLANTIATGSGSTVGDFGHGDTGTAQHAQIDIYNCLIQRDPVFGSVGRSGNNSGDPMYVDLSSDNYRVGRGSPAIDRGDNGAISGFPTDLDGISRVADGDGNGIATVDIGAYELVPAPAISDRQSLSVKRGSVVIPKSGKIAH